MWFQKCDDKRNNKIRKTFYEKYKLPLLVSSIVGLLLQANIRKDKFISWDSTELYLDSPISIDMLDTIGPASPNNILKNPNLNLLKQSELNLLKKPKLVDSKFSDQQIYTDLPDF
jgi:hypothetical protein